MLSTRGGVAGWSLSPVSMRQSVNEMDTLPLTGREREGGQGGEGAGVSGAR
jgi:hypothetical protein